MIRIRPYKTADSDEILSWCQDETTFYRWTAGVLGNYPVTQKEFGFVIIKPDKRGKGYGKMMLQLGLKFVFELYGARRAS